MSAGHWCVHLPTWRGMASIGPRPETSGKNAADEYREGYTGWQAQQGESLAMAADPFGQRQGISPQTGD